MRGEIGDAGAEATGPSLQEIVDRIARLENAVTDLAALVAEGAVARPSVFLSRKGAAARDRFIGFLDEVRSEQPL